MTGLSIRFLAMVQRALAASGLRGELFDGTLSAQNRSDVVRRFLASDAGSPRVLFLSMKAGGTGLNLVPGPTAMLVLDFWYSPAVHRQVEKRIHRRGQDKPVEIVNLVWMNTVESVILNLHEDKTGCANVMMGDSDLAEGVADIEWKKKCDTIVRTCRMLPGACAVGGNPPFYVPPLKT